MNNFAELTLSPVLQKNLAHHGFVQPTGIQTEAIPPALAGQDIVATANTGTGKTLAFAIPMLQSLIASSAKGVSAIVLTPTRELAIQIHETFTKLASGTGMRAAVVVGGLNENRQLREINGGAQVIIATPGRLFDFMGRRLVKLDKVSMLVLDEADRMLDMGFLPVVERIFSAIPESRQTLFFSATIEKSVAHLLDKHVRNATRIAVGAATKPAENIDLHVYEIEHHRKLGLLRSMLEKEQGSFLVFARTKRGTDRLAQRLSRSGVKAIGIHGDRTQNQRNQALHGFKQGYYRVLVATDVAARGIHVDGIAHVVNFDLPQAPEDFTHRVGRTGRAGQRGTAWTFAASNERRELRNLERSLKVRFTSQTVPAELPADVDHVEETVVAETFAPVYKPKSPFGAKPFRPVHHAENGNSRFKGPKFKSAMGPRKAKAPRTGSFKSKSAR
jgi:ATP-dependent RNA helicase RhlE